MNKQFENIYTFASDKPQQSYEIRGVPQQKVVVDKEARIGLRIIV